MFLLGVKEKENKNKEKYLIVSLADTEGNNYPVMSKELSYKELDSFKPYNVVLTLSNSAYGLRLTIDSIN